MAYYKIGYFLLLLPVTLFMYQLVPKKLRWFVLFCSSLVFLQYFSGKYVFYIGITGVIAYVAALVLKLQKKK